jgi:hypothetical protein
MTSNNTDPDRLLPDRFHTRPDHSRSLKTETMKPKQQWEITYAVYGGNQTVVLLEQGWQPFAVSPSNETFAAVFVFVWYRRQTENNEN